MLLASRKHMIMTLWKSALEGDIGAITGAVSENVKCVLLKDEVNYFLTYVKTSNVNIMNFKNEMKILTE